MVKIPLSTVVCNKFMFAVITAGYVKIESPVASCANFHLYTKKSVEAIFSLEGVNGTIRLSQQNPYQPTRLDVNLQVRVLIPCVFNSLAGVNLQVLL